jgi:Zn-dependent peptidase ImmA (M78 family)
MKSDDATLEPASQKQIRKYADLLLREADAYGRFPTPVEDLIAAAELEIARENALDKVFLGSIYRALPNGLKLLPDRLKRAASKVLGLLDRRDRTLHLDKDVHKRKVPFLSVHEVAHDFLPWQRKTYDVLEDSDTELDQQTHDKFEREANCFSSDVLFQLDGFAAEAADYGKTLRHQQQSFLRSHRVQQ